MLAALRNGLPQALALVTGLLLLASGIRPAHPADAQDLLAGVVRIETKVGGMPSIGSGFIVHIDGNSAYVATAAHVVEGDPAPKLFFRSKPHQARAAKVIAQEAGDPNGLALLLVEGGFPKDLPVLPMAAGGGDDLELGQAVTAWGIPADIRHWAAIPGSVVSRNNRKFIFSGGVDQGNSGGPLVVGSAVVGMVMDTTRFGQAVPASSLRIFLAFNHVTWSSQGGTPGSAHAEPPEMRPARIPGDVFRDCDTCPEMVVIPAGAFRMGSLAAEKGHRNVEAPVHTVTFDKPFAIARHEVTFDQWGACVQEGGCRHTNPEDSGWGRGQRPVILVSWDDATEYVRWLSRKTRQSYRLPSEAEWEYAARAGTNAARYWGNDPDAACNYENLYDLSGKRKGNFGVPHSCDDGYAKTAPVARFQANAFGLSDMLGNVAEYTDDCWTDSYQHAPEDGSAWTSGDCDWRVYRGSHWGSVPDDARSAFRGMSRPFTRSANWGFRPARTL